VPARPYLPEPDRGFSARSDRERHERLLDLAYDISTRLRRHAQPAVRVSAALLLAASLAACEADSGDDSQGGQTAPLVEPLTQEVRTGLPDTPGRYPIPPDSLRRDEQGVYHFSWLQPGSSSGSGTPASASLLRLDESNAEALEVPEQGDPILHLRQNSQFQLASAAGIATPIPGGGSGSSFVYWRPLYSGGVRGPAYYDPPQSVPSSGFVDTARSSFSPAAPAARTFGLAYAVSGRAGGTGAGTAASLRSGSIDGANGGKSGVTSPASSGFSSGGAASAKASGSS